jgi:uncharacterized membrane protein YedE/YeeE
MAYENLKNAALPRSLMDVIADIADLLQKEIRLARAEVMSKLSARLQAGVWIVAAGILGFITALLLVAGLVLGVASYGIAMHWACVIVAAIFGVVAVLVFLKGHADAQKNIAPNRTFGQLRQDIAIAKEHLS